MPIFSWSELHGALTHIPVAFLMGVAVFELGAIILRKPVWRVVSFWLLAGAVLVAIPTLITGWITGVDLKFIGSSAAPPEIFLRHRIAAFALTGLASVLLFWRIRARDQLQGKAYIISVALTLLVAAVVTYTGFLGGRMVFGAPTSKTVQSSEYVPIAPGAKIPNVSARLVADGEKLFQTLPCQSCHRMNGKGGISGPDLTHEAQRNSDMDWQIRHLKDPAILKKDADMPSFDDLSPEELKSLAAFLVTRK